MTNKTFGSLPAPQLAEMSFSTPLTSIAALTDERLYAATGVRIAFTNRLAGFSPTPYKALNLSDAVGDVPAAVRSNRRVVFDSLQIFEERDNLINPKQVHGTDFVIVDDVDAAKEAAAQGADGIVCAQRDVPVMLCFADCVPVVLVAPNGAFAVVHSGWRGAIEGIAGMGLTKLCAEADCAPDQVNCYIGPHIDSCCYETSEEILKRFVDAFGPECDAGERHLSLTATVVKSLLDAGAVPQRIIDSKVCTCCNNDRYFSYRADGGTTGRNTAIAFRGDIPATEEEGEE